MESGDYRRAIVHFDGDSFFASVEQALDYRLRGRPVITGGERGAATSLSYEAKRLGLNRGVPMREIRRRCPDAVIVASNYTAYSIFARRMYAIAREFTPLVEEYSIDECFADITDAAPEHGLSYDELALRIKAKLEQSLGITFGVGLASSKTLAKVASAYRKPGGFTPLPEMAREEFLARIPIHDVWGIGGSTSTRLKQLGIQTALDLASKTRAWVDEHELGKAVREILLELQGHALRRLGSGHKFQSIMHTRTFSPPSRHEAFIFAQLSKNVEAACAKLRRHRAKAHGASFYLKTQEFTYHSVKLEFVLPTDDPSEVLRAVRFRFSEVYASGILYRASGITLHTLVPEHALMPSLFSCEQEDAKNESVLSALDALNKRHGSYTVFLGSTLMALTGKAKPRTQQAAFLYAGASGKKAVDIPYLGRVR